MPRLLFVCVENANRSQMAEGFARFHGGYQVEAVSAGSRPADRVDPRAIEAMAELGIDISAQSPRSLDEVTGEFDAVVTMGCADACPRIPARLREDWPVKDPEGRSDQAYLDIRNDVRQRVQTLIANLRSHR
jgi:arsenate reductase